MGHRQAKDDETAALARLRLAGIRLDEKKYDEALALLEAKHAEAFVPLYADLRGDILAAQGKPAEARAATNFALEKSCKQQLSQRCRSSSTRWDRPSEGRATASAARGRDAGCVPSWRVREQRTQTRTAAGVQTCGETAGGMARQCRQRR
jgi:hypothetical protein